MTRKRDTDFDEDTIDEVVLQFISGLEN